MKQPTTAALQVCIGILISLGLCLRQNLTVAHAQARDNLAAVVNGRNITQAEVDNAVFSQLFSLQQQIYAIRKAALENLISRALLDEEATKRGISVEELKKQLTAGRVEIPASQVDELYSENASVFGAMSPDEARLRLRLDLESQARMRNYREALSRLKEASQIRWLMEEPRLPPVSDLNAPSIGPRKAIVTLIEFSDFQCPFCRSSQSAIKEVLKSYKSDVRLVFKHRPLESHAQAFTSAQAAFCAGRQGAFWQYHDLLFMSEDLSPETLNKLAASIHLNLSEFGNCMKSDPARAAVQNDVDEAKRLGIDSTPTFVINGNLFRGALSFEDFKAAIEQELKRRGNNQ
jgi:predicted DsbA family dithiol-disulfide isomerase